MEINEPFNWFTLAMGQLTENSYPKAMVSISRNFISQCLNREIQFTPKSRDFSDFM